MPRKVPSIIHHQAYLNVHHHQRPPPGRRGWHPMSTHKKYLNLLPWIVMTRSPPPASLSIFISKNRQNEGDTVGQVGIKLNSRKFENLETLGTNSPKQSDTTSPAHWLRGTMRRQLSSERSQNRVFSLSQLSVLKEGGGRGLRSATDRRFMAFSRSTFF